MFGKGRREGSAGQHRTGRRKQAAPRRPSWAAGREETGATAVVPGGADSLRESLKALGQGLLQAHVHLERMERTKN